MGPLPSPRAERAGARGPALQAECRPRPPPPPVLEQKSPRRPGPLARRTPRGRRACSAVVSVGSSSPLAPRRTAPLPTWFPESRSPDPATPHWGQAGVGLLALPGLCPRRGVAHPGPGGAGPALRAEREGTDGSAGGSGGSGGRSGGPGANRALTTSVRAETRGRAPCAGRVRGLAEPPAPAREGQAALGSARWALRPPFTPSAKAGSRGLFKKTAV